MTFIVSELQVHVIGLTLTELSLTYATDTQIGATLKRSGLLNQSLQANEYCDRPEASMSIHSFAICQLWRHQAMSAQEVSLTKRKI